MSKELTKEVGRPTIMTPEILNKLEEVFAIGGSDEEACFYAGIGKSTLYNYQERHPEFVERKEALKNKPILKARQTVVKGLDDTQNAQWYLTKKRKAEFADPKETESGGSSRVTNIFLMPGVQGKVKELEEALKESFRNVETPQKSLGTE